MITQSIAEALDCARGRPNVVGGLFAIATALNRVAGVLA
jgi:hypothetical protein